MVRYIHVYMYVPVLSRISILHGSSLFREKETERERERRKMKGDSDLNVR